MCIFVNNVCINKQPNLSKNKSFHENKQQMYNSYSKMIFIKRNEAS